MPLVEIHDGKSNTHLPFLSGKMLGLTFRLSYVSALILLLESEHEAGRFSAYNVTSPSQDGRDHLVVV